MLIAYRILNRLDINSVIHPDPASEYLKARKAAPLALGFAMPFIWIALYHFASALPEPAYLNAVRYSLIAGAGICISTLLLSMLPATGSVFRYFYSGLGPAHGERDVSKNAAIAAAIGLTLVGIIDRAPVEARDLLWGIGSLMMGGAWLPYVVASGYALVLLGLYPGDTSDDSVV